MMGSPAQDYTANKPKGHKIKGAMLKTVTQGSMYYETRSSWLDASLGFKLPKTQSQIPT